MKEITTGLTATATITVTEHNTAIAMKSGDLPVFATPSMCALMEEAAKDAIAPQLEDGYTTVGISLSITHDAPSPIGATVTSTATVTAVDSKKIIFAICATDGTHTIGKGEHVRYIVHREKFMNKLA